ncbi:hypothetical protein [Pseudomonas sp.]|uniref:hypothetical protein n=1 Tax=Pseudomonas sp. TaxID=306 RepID=UPI003266BE6E
MAQVKLESGVLGLFGSLIKTNFLTVLMGWQVAASIDWCYPVIMVFYQSANFLGFDVLGVVFLGAKFW